MTHRSGLAFKSKLQVNALKGLGTGPLSADDRKLLGLTTPPRDAALTACAKGCASLIRSGRAARPDGKKEAEIIIEAVANADAQLGKQLKAAVEGKVTVQIIGPTRAISRSAPFKDPVLQRVVEVMHDALSKINPTSVAQNREYFLVIFMTRRSPPGTPEEDVLRTIRASAPVGGDKITVEEEDRARIIGLAEGGEILAWAHTHGATMTDRDSENFSDTPGDLNFSRSNGWHAGLATPSGRFLFFHLDEDREYDLSSMLGSIPF